MNYLFHKEYLNQTKREIKYDIIQETNNRKNNKYICKFHIFDLNCYKDFEQYILILNKHFNVIITTHVTSNYDIPKDVTIIQIPNVGFDV